jgi:hypothetical protein
MAYLSELFSSDATDWVQYVTATGTAVLDILGPGKSDMTTRQWLLWEPKSKMTQEERDRLWHIALGDEAEE